MSESMLRCTVYYASLTSYGVATGKCRWKWEIEKVVDSPKPWNTSSTKLAFGSSRWRWKAIYQGRRALARFSSPATFIADGRSIEQRIAALETELKVAA